MVIRLSPRHVGFEPGRFVTARIGIFQSIISVRTAVDVPIATPHCQNATGLFLPLYFAKKRRRDVALAALHRRHRAARHRVRTLAADDTTALLQLDDNPTSAENARRLALDAT